MPKKTTCIIVDDEPMAREILTTFISKFPNLELKASCANVSEAMEILKNHSIDLLFLDINMPEISGISLAKSIQKPTKIIFTTAYREYALEGFNLHAVDYLLKPISFDRFLTAVHKFYESSAPKTPQISHTAEVLPNNDFIFVRSDRKMIKVNFSSILYVESLSDYLKIHTPEKIIVTRETINNMENKLPFPQFIRTHRSFIVSIQQILSYTNEYIEIKNKSIPISRSYKEEVLEKLQSM